LGYAKIFEKFFGKCYRIALVVVGEGDAWLLLGKMSN
jgi:hypothetical protein